LLSSQRHFKIQLSTAGAATLKYILQYLLLLLNVLYFKHIVLDKKINKNIVYIKMILSETDQAATASDNAILSSKATAGSQGIELFIGNLSFFCEEGDLMKLIQSKTEVESVRICRSQRRGNSSLCYGFVVVKDSDQAHVLTTNFHGSLFMGRRLR
jgi:RNA recognition motif-containing protein